MLFNKESCVVYDGEHPNYYLNYSQCDGGCALVELIMYCLAGAFRRQADQCHIGCAPRGRAILGLVRVHTATANNTLIVVNAVLKSLYLNMSTRSRYFISVFKVTIICYDKYM